MLSFLYIKVFLLILLQYQIICSKKFRKYNNLVPSGNQDILDEFSIKPLMRFIFKHYGTSPEELSYLVNLLLHPHLQWGLSQLKTVLQREILYFDQKLCSLCLWWECYATKTIKPNQQIIKTFWQCILM